MGRARQRVPIQNIQQIYDQFYSIPYVNAFTYPSVRTKLKTGYNIIFSTESAKDNLELLGVMVCQLQEPTPESEFSMKHFYDGFLNEAGTFDFYPANNPQTREKFGTFAYLRDMYL